MGGDQGGAGPVEPRQVTFHPAAKKELAKLDGESRKRVANTISALQRGDEGVQTHALLNTLKGWHSTKATRGHRAIHRTLDDGTLHIGYVGLHDYDKANKRLSSLTGFFREAGLPQEWYHGSGAAFDRFDLDKNKTVQEDDAKHWNSHLGAHFTSDHRVAQEFAQRQDGGHVYHARLDLQNPKHYESEHDLDKEAVHWALGNGHDMGVAADPAFRERTEPDEWQFLLKYDDHNNSRTDTREIAHGFRDHLKAQGHDGITYGNEFEGAHNGFHAGERHLSAIAFHPDQIQITQRHGGNGSHGPRSAALQQQAAVEGADSDQQIGEEILRGLQRQAAAVNNSGGVMVAFVPPREIAEQVVQEGGQPVEDLHATLAYLGRVSDYSRDQLEALPRLVGGWAVHQKPLTLRVGGVLKFSNSRKGQHVLAAAMDILGGAQMHSSLAQFLQARGYRFPSEHGWLPHMTLSFVNEHFRFMPRLGDHAWDAVGVVTYVGGERFPARFGGRPSTPTTL